MFFNFDTTTDKNNISHKIYKYSKREYYKRIEDIPKKYGNIKETIYNNYYIIDKGIAISYNVQCNYYIILKPGVDKAGYKRIVIIKNGKRLTISVHRLVLLTFNPIANYKNYQVNHIDENTNNNCLENLEWCTPQYNTEYSQAKKVNCYKYPSMEFVGTFASTHDAARKLHLLQGEIINVINKRRNQKHTKRYTFRYV